MRLASSLIPFALAAVALTTVAAQTGPARGQRRPHPATHHRTVEIRHEPRRRREPRRVQRRRHRRPRLHQEAHAGRRARSARRHRGQHPRPARRQRTPKLPPIMIGSHIDSVPGWRQLRRRRRRARRDRSRADAEGTRRSPEASARSRRLRRRGGRHGRQHGDGRPSRSLTHSISRATAARPFATASARSAEIPIVWPRRDASRAT